MNSCTWWTSTAAKPVVDLATQAIDALVQLKNLVTEITTASTPTTAAEQEPPAGDLDDLIARRDKQIHLLRSALVLGKKATSGRGTKLERKYNTLFTRMITRWADYQRFVHDPVVSFDNNTAEQTIRMPKLRVKVAPVRASQGTPATVQSWRSSTSASRRPTRKNWSAFFQATRGHFTARMLSTRPKSGSGLERAAMTTGTTGRSGSWLPVSETALSG